MFLFDAVTNLMSLFIFFCVNYRITTCISCHTCFPLSFLSLVITFLLPTFFIPLRLFFHLFLLSFLLGEMRWHMPDCNTRNRGMKKGWQEQQMVLQNEAPTYFSRLPFPPFSSVLTEKCLSYSILPPYFPQSHFTHHLTTIMSLFT